MLIYIMHRDRIFTFRLPKAFSGNYVLFDCDERGIKRSLVNVYAYDNSKWVMKSNDDVQIYYNGQYAENIELKTNNFYQLNVLKTENLLLYAMPASEAGYISKTIADDECTLTIGKKDCDITYNFSGIEEKQVELTYKDGYWKYRNLNEKVPIYVNRANIKECKLSNLDVIFIMGLKIVVSGKTIFIKAPGNNVYFFNNKLVTESAYLTVKDREINNEVYKDFYETNEYFNKSPIFRKKINTLKLTITSPSDKEKSDQGSLLLQIVPSLLLSLTSLLQAYYSISNYRKGQADKESVVTTLLMCFTMLFISLIWPFVERFAFKIRSFINEKRRVYTYTKYLKGKRSVLEAARNEQKMALEVNNVSLEQCANIIQNKIASLFSSGIEQEDFLNVRLGKGRVLLDSEINYVRPDFIETKDKLLDDIDKLLDEYKYIDDVPFSISLSKMRSLAFINNNKNYVGYMNAILLQLLTFHDYATLKLVIFTTDTSSNLVNLKNLNHCWDNEKSIRFFATNLNEAENVSAYLIRVLNQRLTDSKNVDSANAKKSKMPFYLIISDHLEMYRNLKIIEDVLDNDADIGFGVVMFGQKLTDIPEGCANFVDYNEKEASIFKSEMSEDNIHRFVPEFLNDKIDFNYYVRLIGNIPIQIAQEKQGKLPTRLGFLEMYGVGKIEQLNILNRWKNSNITTTLAAPIGVDYSGNIISLDLHETKHGPHGLIAGMTGSGKSEFIITYILSLAVNYSPDEVQFVLIDYKGGGLAGAFENRKTKMKLPHLVGTITNLDKSEMNRTLVSINSELQRRQRIFNEAKERLDTGTIDIYKYQKLHRDGVLEEPLSHLFVICDEFAELKAQQPDFMDELVSAARIGRSLGIHLILATQKPSGVVDDQIWSNSKFKVCCKVQTVEDSNEMIKRPDAAYIKEAGRFYLQIGYDEFFILGQSGYSGVSYNSTETVISKIDNSINFITNTGEVYQNVDKKEQVQKKKENLGEELINILKYIIDVANKQNFKYKQLWLDSLPKTIYLDNLRKKYEIARSAFNISALIGEYDDPRNQRQGPVVLDITKGGNLYISGVAGSGKTTLLSTLIYSVITTHSVEEVNFYIVDLGAESLRSFSLAPQVGDVLTISEKDRIIKMFYYLRREMDKRKKYYATKGGSFENDVRKGKSVFPNIIVAINGYDIFKEQFDDFSDSFLPSFTRECNRYGITNIFVGVSTSLGYLVENNFPNKIALKLADPVYYSDFVGHTRIIPNDNPGRGMIAIDDQAYEFQTSLISDYDNLNSNLTYVINQLEKIMKTKAPQIPEIPNHVTISSFKDESIALSLLPIGYETMSACPYFYNFDKLINVITYGKASSANSFVPALVNLLSYLNNVKNIVLSAYDSLIIDNDNVKFYNANFKSILIALYRNISKALNDNENKNKYVITVFGYSKLQSHMKKLKTENNDQEISHLDEIVDLDDLIMLAKDSDKVRFILIDDMNILRSVDNTEWYSLFDSKNGILISGDIDNQDLFVTDSSYSNNVIMRDDAIVINNAIKEYIKFVNIK